MRAVRPAAPTRRCTAPPRRSIALQRAPLADVGKLFGKHKFRETPDPLLVEQQMRRTLIFGYGNHIWPRSRVSAGLWAKNLGLEFKRNDLLQYDIAEAPRILFARPTCYLPENRYKYIKRLLNQYSLTPKELVLVYPDENVRTGQWKEVSAGGGEGSHILCEELGHYLNDESFTRIGVGVGRKEAESFITRETSWRPPADWNEAFMRMKPPPPQMREILAAAAHIHHHWNTKYAEELGEIRDALEIDAQAAAQIPVEVDNTITMPQRTEAYMKTARTVLEETSEHFKKSAAAARTHKVADDL